MAMSQPENSIPNTDNSKWVVSAEEAKQLIERGATILDVRGQELQEQGHLLGAIPVTWEQFSQAEAPLQGKLLEDDEVLTQMLQAVGVSDRKPVVVIADPINGGGEDGRIVWMLRTLGHQQAVFVDGGYEALIKVGVATVQTATNTSPTPSDFVVKRSTVWEIQRDELKASLENKNIVLIDAREAREYAGETPYGEQRGGHVLGAIHLYYKDLLAEDGKLLPRGEIFAKLPQKAIAPQSEIVCYCTGGVRSGWLTSVLVTLGLQAKNYTGSMWEWSASPAENYPLEKIEGGEEAGEGEN